MRDGRYVLHRGLLGVALLATAWAVIVVATGGIDVRLAGVALTSHDVWRPLLVAAVALAAFFASGGRFERRLFRAPGLMPPPWALATALAAAVLVVAWTHGSKTAGGSDSYGYVSQSDLWLSGRLVQPQPWALEVPWPAGPRTFQPLGYRLTSDRSSLVPVYAPGLPMLMAIAKAAGGHCAAFAVVPLAAAILVLATFGVGVRLGSPWMGVTGAWLVATSPVFLMMALSPMSDVPEAAAWAAAFYFMLGRTTGSAALSGLAASVAALIRLNLAPLTVVPAAWFVVRVLAAQEEDRAGHLRRAGAFLAAVAPGLIAVAAIAQYLYGSPFRSGYGDASAMFSATHVWPNLANYGAWLIESQSPAAIAGILALAIPSRRLWPARAPIAALVAFAVFTAVVVGQYLFYLVFEVWWYLRFLLPCWPFLMLGVGAWFVRISERGWLARLAIVAAALALGWRGLAFEPGILDTAAGERRYAVAAGMVDRLTEPGSVVMAMQHSGTVRYYAGRMTLTYTELDGEWLDRAVEWMGERGVRVYALLDSWEVSTFRERFGSTPLGRLERDPIAVAEPWEVALYDLTPAGIGRAPLPVFDRAADACALPATPPGAPFASSAR